MNMRTWNEIWSSLIASINRPVTGGGSSFLCLADSCFVEESLSYVGRSFPLRLNWNVGELGRRVLLRSNVVGPTARRLVINKRSDADDSPSCRLVAYFHVGVVVGGTVELG